MEEVDIANIETENRGTTEDTEDTESVLESVFGVFGAFGGFNVFKSKKGKYRVKPIRRELRRICLTSCQGTGNDAVSLCASAPLREIVI